VALFKLDIELLLTPPFKRNLFLVFIIHWMAWLVLHFIIYLPTLLNMKRIVWDSFLFTHLVLVTVNFLLFYIVAFYILPLMGTFRKRWFWILIVSLLMAILVTYLRFRLQMAWADYAIDKGLWNKFSRKPPHESYSFFSYRFRSYFQTNILTIVSIVILAFAYRLLLIWFQQEKIRLR